MTEVDRVVSRARRGRAVFVGLFALVCFGGIAWAIVVNFQQDTKITKVERSACAQAPASRECQKVKRRSDRQRSIADTCIAFWKVGYRCPAPSSGISVPPRGGDALQPAPAGQLPAPAPAGDDGSTRPPQKGGNDDVDPLPPSSPNQPAGEEPAVQPSPSPATTPTGEPAPAPSTPAVPPEPESAPGLLDPALTTVCSIVDRIAHLCS
jgi:hypothetical protein